MNACESEPEDCTRTLEEWCEGSACEGYENLEDALDSDISQRGVGSSIERCGDRTLVVLGDTYNSWSYLYESESGELVGASNFSELGSGDECEVALEQAGERTRCEAEGCMLLGFLHGRDGACSGAIAAPYVAACLAEPTAVIDGCEACACPACYPPLVLCSALEPDIEAECSMIVIGCLQEHCPGECEVQIEAILQAP